MAKQTLENTKVRDAGTSSIPLTGSQNLQSAGRQSQAVIAAIEKNGSLSQACRKELLSLSPDAANALLSFIQSASPEMKAALTKIAGQDPAALTALAHFLNPRCGKIAGMQDAIQELMRAQTVSEARACQLLANQFLDEAAHAGNREQGTRALCVEAAIVRNFMSGGRYLRSICDLSVRGETKLQSGRALHAPSDWKPFKDPGKAYHSQKPGEDLLMCSMNLMLRGDNAGIANISGGYALEAKEKLDAVTGEKHSVAFGRLGLLFAIAQLKDGGPIPISLKWAPEGVNDLSGDHTNHCVTIREILPDGRVVVANTWGSPVMKDRDLTKDGPASRRRLLGTGEEGLETLSLEEVAKRINWVSGIRKNFTEMEIDGSKRNSAIEITPERLKQAGLDGMSALKAEIAKQEAMGVSNMSIQQIKGKTYLVMNTASDPADISRLPNLPGNNLPGGICYGVTGFDYMGFVLLCMNKKPDTQQKKKEESPVVDLAGAPEKRRTAEKPGKTED